MFYGLSLLIVISFVFVRNSICLHNNSRVEGNFRRICDCIGACPPSRSFEYPGDADEHYQFLLHKTAQYRNIPCQVYGNPANESFIEKLFIERFLSQPVSSFGGMIPLFVQWSDYQLSHRELSTKADEYAMFHPLLKYLRPNVVYVTVSQANKGIRMFSGMCNVLVLSAGGVGHVPIPLVKGALNHSQFNASAFSPLGFYGSVSHGPRERLLNQLRATVQQQSQALRLRNRPHISDVVMRRSPLWVTDVEQTLFNLVPVGFGRGSFRLSEVVRIGRIPVYLFEDFPWLPYEGTDVSPEVLGLIAQPSQFTQLTRQMNHLIAHSHLIEQLLTRVQQAHFVYTNEGVLQQMQLFFEEPFIGGYLRCSERSRQFQLAQSRDVFKKLTTLFTTV